MIFKNLSPLLQARLQALFVTFLWSTSWVLIKFGLVGIPPLTFAGLRYTLAFFFLIPLLLRKRRNHKLTLNLDLKGWIELVVYGLVFYTVTQGAQFVSLKYLPAVTTSLILSFTAVVVALVGSAFLNERLNRLQWLGMGIYLTAILVYFYPVRFPKSEVFGLVVAVVGMLANAAGAILGRRINRRSGSSAIFVTVVSMGIGAVMLDITAVALNGLPQLNLQQWAIIIWLALVNSAFAFVLWNHSQKTLPAAESSLINNTMLFQIAVLAWVFLGESIGVQQLAAMLLAVCAMLMVQLPNSRAK